MILSLETGSVPYSLAPFLKDTIDANNVALYFGESVGESTPLETVQSYFDFDANFDDLDDGIISFTSEVYSIDASYTIGTVPTSTTLLLSNDYTYTIDMLGSGQDQLYEHGMTCQAGSHGLYLKISNIVNTTPATLTFDVSDYAYVH